MACSTSTLKPHDRIVLLFDLDCFYAQCERVRLGLDVNIALALLQWNSVLAVTYPARSCGIQRGDSWEDVQSKSNGDCWAIHLHILSKQQQQQQHHQEIQGDDHLEHKDEEEEEEEEEINDIEQAYNKIYQLSHEEQVKCQQSERGVRRYHHEGKACLERYRIASMRIFNVVLESLTRRLSSGSQNTNANNQQKNSSSCFTLERASIDEFYLDLTAYCYDPCQGGLNNNKNNISDATNEEDDAAPNTIHVGKRRSDDEISRAIQKASLVSQWIRQDVWTTLGFTMSAGISTNKMMAKLAAGFGKPNGQAILHPCNFDEVLRSTKLRKVRNFGGKLGRQVQQVLLQQHIGDDKDQFTMGDVQQCSLPTLQQGLGGSVDTAQFVFDACRGIDREQVRDTKGALVKSITAFKSFPATKNQNELEGWLELLANEIVSRVAKDSVRNHRYPKSCTLNYSPAASTGDARPRRGVFQQHSKSVRLVFPPESSSLSIQVKAHDLVTQAVEKLSKLGCALRGVGLSVGNFEALRQEAPEGVPSIDSFFRKCTAASSSSLRGSSTNSNKKRSRNHNRLETSFEATSSTLDGSHSNITAFDSMTDDENSKLTTPQTQPQSSISVSDQALQPSPNPSQIVSLRENPMPPSSSDVTDGYDRCQNNNAVISESSEENSKFRGDEIISATVTPSSILDKDLELAKKLQASFDREQYLASLFQRPTAIAGGNVGNRNQSNKVRRIDTFFTKRR